MACLQPATDLTPDEQECCRHMEHQCGDSGMGESHACCRTEVRSPGTMLVVAKMPVRVQAASVALLPSFNQAIAHLNADGFSPTRIPSARAGPRLAIPQSCESRRRSLSPEGAFVCLRPAPPVQPAL